MIIWMLTFFSWNLSPTKNLSLSPVLGCWWGCRLCAGCNLCPDFCLVSNWAIEQFKDTIPVVKAASHIQFQLFLVFCLLLSYNSLCIWNEHTCMYKLSGLTIQIANNIPPPTLELKSSLEGHPTAVFQNNHYGQQTKHLQCLALLRPCEGLRCREYLNMKSFILWQCNNNNNVNTQNVCGGIKLLRQFNVNHIPWNESF